MPRTYIGRLEDFFETGSEGTHWMLERDLAPGEEVQSGYDLLVLINPGDRLEVYDDDGSVLWSGVIDPDTASNWFPYPYNPIYGQQAAGGRWVHWLQRGVAPESWAKMFYDHKRAHLTKARWPGKDRRGMANTDEVLPRMSDVDLVRISPKLAFGLCRYLQGLPDDAAIGLLGIDHPTLLAWREKPEDACMTRLQINRIAVLLGMFRILSYLVWKKEERNAWLTRINPTLGDTPVAIMTAAGTGGIRRVRKHLEAAIERAHRTRNNEIVF